MPVMVKLAVVFSTVIAEPSLLVELMASGPMTYGFLAVPAPVAQPHVVKPSFPLMVIGSAA
jgi:hypothetical protein